MAPVSGRIAWEVHEGRATRNFSPWNRDTPQELEKKRQARGQEGYEADLPPWDSLLRHREARLAREDRARLQPWARQPSAPAR